MQIGQTIWAIDQCYDGSGENPRLTIGRCYEITGISEGEILIKNDFLRDHYFSMQNFDKYFSLTPPKEKEGVREYLVLTTPTKTIVVGTFDEHKEIPFDIYTKDNKGIFSYLDETQAAQLRDHLTEALNKLK